VQKSPTFTNLLSITSKKKKARALKSYLSRQYCISLSFGRKNGKLKLSESKTNFPFMYLISATQEKSIHFNKSNCRIAYPWQYS
jgi:hypothetical protein